MRSQRNEVGDNYVLATGDAGAARLEMLDDVSFLEGSAYEPGLPHGQFDLV